MTPEEAIKQSRTRRAFSEDGSASIWQPRAAEGSDLLWSPLINNRDRPRLSDLRRLKDSPMEGFLRGMTWLPEHPKDPITLLGEVAHGEEGP